MNRATDSRPGPNAKRHDATADIDLRRPRAEELPKQGHHSLSMGRVAGEEALRFSLHFDKHSKLLAKQSDEKKRTITELRWSDLEIGKLLGEGNFSHVYEVRLIDREVDSDTVVTGMDTIDDVWRSNSSWKVPDGEGGDVDVWDLISVTNVIDLEETTSESDFNVSTSEGENSTLTTKPRRRDRVYALKHLHPQVTKKQKSFTASAIDLVLEAKLLSCLNHRNIIKLYAVTEGSLNRAFTDSGYFLLLDRLYEVSICQSLRMTALSFVAPHTITLVHSQTLEEKIQAWSMKEKMPANKERAGRRNRLVAITRTQDHSHITERIDVAIEIVRGMEYLHSNRIIYRDLKVSRTDEGQ
jgi:serine/threonine protein kinase